MSEPTTQYGKNFNPSYVAALGAALAEAGYPHASINVLKGCVTVGCIPHGMDPADNPEMPPEAVLDKAYELCRPLRRV